jgi:hypothetical protein
MNTNLQLRQLFAGGSKPLMPNVLEPTPATQVSAQPGDHREDDKEEEEEVLVTDVRNS